MKRIGFRRRSKKKGLPPGSIVPIGQNNFAPLKASVIDFDANSFLEKHSQNWQDATTFCHAEKNTWINIEGLSDVESLSQLGATLGLNPLLLEDIVNAEQRPKVEIVDGKIYIILKMLGYDDASNHVLVEQVSLVIARNYVITFQEGLEGDVFEPIRTRLRDGIDKSRRLKNDYLAVSLIDAIVDFYFIVMEKMGDAIEKMEDRLVANPNSQLLNDIHHLKREIIFLRKSVWPLREMLGTLLKLDEKHLCEEGRIFLRDVHDHTIQIVEIIETYRDLLGGMIDMYLNFQSHKMNEVMKILAVITTIFMPLSFIAGVYGMNFEAMPELKSPLGYPVVIGVMAAIAIFMTFYFKKKKWF